MNVTAEGVEIAAQLEQLHVRSNVNIGKDFFLKPVDCKAAELTAAHRSSVGSRWSHGFYHR